MDIAEIWNQYKKTILIVGVNLAGILVIVALVALLRRFATGPVPDPERASPQAVVTYLATQFQGQSDSFKLQYLPRVMNYYTESPERVQQLSQAVDQLSEYQAMQLRDNFVDSAVLQLGEDSKVYNALRDRAQQRGYIDSKLGYWSGVQAMITGQSGGGGSGGIVRRSSGGGNGPNIAANPKFSKDIPKDTPGIYKLFIDKTKPADRARLEGYMNDVQNRAQQLKDRARR